MPSIALVVPGSLAQRTGGYLYNQHVVDGLRQLGWTAGVVEIDPSFPCPTSEALDRASQALAALDAGTIAVIDSLALGAMPDVVASAARRLRVVALVHLPLAAAWGLDHEAAFRLEQGERRALHAAALVIVTGRATLSLLARHDLPSDRVLVVEPGTDRAPLARGSAGPRLELLSVATLNPGKGHEWLLDALSNVRDVSWRLTCAGSLTRHPETVDRVRAAIVRLGLEDRVRLAGELDDVALAGCYDGADLFVSASRQETYGMAVAEAVARGLPVVAATTGAIPQIVGDGGLLVEVGNTAALTAALSRVMGDATLRARLANGARRQRDTLPTWDDASRRMAQALTRIASDG